VSPDYPLDGYLFWFTYLAWFLVEMISTYLIPGLRGRFRRGDRSFYVLFLGIFLSIFLSFYVAFLPLSIESLAFTVLPEAFLYVGSITMLLGLVLRQWSIRVLGRYFSPMVTVDKDQVVVVRGPYRYVRHPAYLGALLEFVGLSLMLRNCLSLLVTTVVFAFTYGYRMVIEERELLRNLGDKYVEYTRRVRWRLIPYIV